MTRVNDTSKFTTKYLIVIKSKYVKENAKKNNLMLKILAYTRVRKVFYIHF